MWVLVVSCAAGVACGLTGTIYHPLPPSYGVENCFAVARNGFRLGGYDERAFDVQCEWHPESSRPRR